MSLTSDLTRLPARAQAELTLAWLQRVRDLRWSSTSDTLWAAGLGEGEQAELFLIALPGAEPEPCNGFLSQLPGARLNDDPRYLRWTLLDLRAGRGKSERLVASRPKEVTLNVLRPSDLAEHLHASPLGGVLAAWDRRRGSLGEGLPWHEELLDLLAADLVADQFTKLSAAGGDKQRRTRLARVFVDLRVGRASALGEDAPLFARDFLKFAALPRRRELTAPLLTRAAARGAHEHLDTSRILLVGGPGQGKTTLGMHVCQLYRAALLITAGSRRISDVASEILSEIRARGGVDAVVGRRIPLRVVLYQLAAQLARGEVHDLWSYLSRYAGKRVGHDRITPDTLRVWLRRWPSLLVLDGLDEVPSSANRDEVLRAVHAFLGELEHASADVVVLATTRPQGYRGELSSEGWSTRTLQELSAEEATTYAGRLLEEWARGDKVRQDELLERVRRAVSEVGAGQLSRSPLQVTILCTLVEQAGRPPRDRWRLFREYFRIIYDRERERGIPAVEVLTDQREVVERLHAEVGYRLHLRSERTRGTEAGLPPDELNTIIQEMLSEEGLQGLELARVTALVREASQDRLVFLVPQGEQNVGFEIRSLQEFFAAERLFLGDEGLLPGRLEAVAAGQHWRNVLRLAVGRVAADRKHLLDRVPALCDRLDAMEGGLGAQARMGARLAVDLLGEVAISGRPKLREILARRALDGFGDLDLLWMDEIVENLGTESRTELLAALERGLGPESRARWEVLIRWGSRGDDGARGLVEERIGGSGDVVGRVLGQLNHQWSPWYESLFQQHYAIFPLDTVLDMCYFGRRSDEASVGHVLEQSVLDRHLQMRDRLLRFRNSEFAPTGLWTPMAGASPLLHMVDAHPSWGALASVRIFTEHPGADTLAMALDALAEADTRNLMVLRRIVPWPLAACLQVDPAERARLAGLARAGALGDRASWEQAEARWSKGSLKTRDLCMVCGPDLPIRPELAREGLAYGTEFYDLTTQVLLDVYNSAGSDAVRHLLLNVWSFVYDDDGGSLAELPTGHEIWDLLASLRGYTARVTLVSRALGSLDDPLWRRRLLGALHSPRAIFFALLNLDEARQSELARQVLTLLPDEPALLPLLIALVEGEGPPPRPDQLPDPATFADPYLVALATFLQASVVTLTEAPDLAPRLLVHASKLPEPWQHLNDILLAQRPPGAVALLRHLLPAVDDPSALLRTLHNLLNQRAAPLHHPAAAAALSLPPDPEAEFAADPAPEAPPAEPVRISRLHLRDLRAWALLDLDLPSPSDQGQWLFFVGENGTGKTTLLRGLALALVGAGTAQGFLSKVSGPLVRLGQPDAEVEVRLSDSRKATLHLHGQELVPNGPPPDLLVVAYGPRRGTLLGQTRQELNFSPGEAVETLFVEGGNLIHARTWLFELERRALRDRGGSDERILQTVKSALVRVLPGVERIDIETDEVYIRGPGVGEVPLGAVSDGYLTTAGWVIDLMARWMERERMAGRIPGPDFPAQMTGLVLIDEIDLHLHPRWQWSLVDDLRRLFPRLSFVVTTHNPVTLQSARPGEIYVLDRDPSGRLCATPRDIPPGTGIEEVLTGAVFGLPSAVDRNTARLLDEHRALLRTAPDSPRRHELELELKSRLGRFSDTSLEGMAASVAAQVLREGADRLSAADREAARQRALDTLRRMKQREGA